MVIPIAIFLTSFNKQNRSKEWMVIMRSFKNFGIAFLILVVFILGLTGCGKKDTDDTPELNTQVELYFSQMTFEIPENIINLFNNFTYYNGYIYTIEYDNTNPNNDFLYDMKLVTLSTDGSIVNEEVFDSFYSEMSFVTNITYSDDGELWIFISQYNAETNEEQSILKKYDTEKNIEVDIDLNSRDLPMNLSETREILISSSGQIYINTGTAVIVLNDNGEVVQRIEESALQIIKTKEGDVLILAQSDSEYTVLKINEGTWNLSSIYNVSNSAYGFFSSSVLGYDFCYYNLDGIYGCSYNQESESLILDWNDFNISDDERFSVFLSQEGDIICLGEQQHIVMFYKNDSDASQGDVEEALDNVVSLKLATIEPSVILTERINNFNSSNSEYIIEVVDYSRYGSPEDEYNQSIEKLNTEIIAGNAPDIIDLHAFASMYSAYVEQGVLLDINSLLTSDNDIDSGDLSEILKKLETQGGIYQISPFFNITTVVAATSVFEDASNFTLSELKSRFPQGGQTFANMGRNDFLELILQYVQPQVDEYFESNEFKDLLEYSAMFPDEVSPDDFVPSSQLISNGDAFFIVETLTNFANYQQYVEIFGEDINFIGFPTDSGGVSCLVLTQPLGITTTSENIDIAWSFLKTLLDPAYQERISCDTNEGFPISKIAMESFINNSMNFSYIDESGEITTDLSVEQKQVDMILNTIDSSVVKLDTDTTIVEIVLEEVQPYFSAEKTVSDVTNIIRNRVQTYLNERK